MQFLQEGIASPTTAQLLIRDWKKPVTLQNLRKILRSSSLNYTNARFQNGKLMREKNYYLGHSTMKKTRRSLYRGYGSIVNHFSFFSFQHSCREFINHNIIVRCHDNCCSKIPADMKKQLHNFI